MRSSLAHLRCPPHGYSTVVCLRLHVEILLRDIIGSRGKPPTENVWGLVEESELKDLFTHQLTVSHSQLYPLDYNLAGKL